jgi:hypothetical protein
MGVKGFMRKSILLLTFVSVFILLSIPVIPSAQKSIVEDDIEERINTSIRELDVDDIRVLLDKIRDRKYNDDCGCESNFKGLYNEMICGILFVIFMPIATLYDILDTFLFLPNLTQFVGFIAGFFVYLLYAFNCIL